MEQRSDRTSHRKRETLPINGACVAHLSTVILALYKRDYPWWSVIVSSNFDKNHLRQPSYPRYLRILRYRYYEGWKVRVKPSDVSKIKLQWQVSDWSVCKFQSFFWFYLTLCNFVSSLFSCNCFSFFCFFFLNGISWLLRKFLGSIDFAIEEKCKYYLRIM